MTVILVIHILASIVLVGVVLMQRSEGGALGISGGGGGGGLMSGRGAAGALVRTTIIFGAIFFVTSLVLTTMTTRHLGDTRTDVERALDEEFGGDALDGGGLDILNDPTAPLLDDEPAADLPSSTALDTDTGNADAGVEGDPLATDVPAETNDTSGDAPADPVEDPR